MQLNSKISNKSDIVKLIKNEGFCVIDASTLSQTTGVSEDEFLGFQTYWDSLCIDNYLKDLGKYRSRRHSSYKVDGGQTFLMPHRAHWQSLHYNALHGGISRMFQPIDDELNNSQPWMKLISSLTSFFPNSNLSNPWYVEAHQFRINTFGGLGRPTPEGAHRDGVDYVAVILVNRRFIKGGETRIFKIDGNEGLRFTLNQPWSLLLMDDRRMIHETTPIQDDGGTGYRDTLVLTFRSDGFQDPS